MVFNSSHRRMLNRPHTSNQKWNTRWSSWNKHKRLDLCFLLKENQAKTSIPYIHVLTYHVVSVMRSSRVIILLQTLTLSLSQPGSWQRLHSSSEQHTEETLNLTLASNLGRHQDSRYTEVVAFVCLNCCLKQILWRPSCFPLKMSLTLRLNCWTLWLKLWMLLAHGSKMSTR